MKYLILVLIVLASITSFSQMFIGPENGNKTSASDDVYYEKEAFAFSDSAGVINLEISVKLVASYEGYSLVKLRKTEIELIDGTYTDFTFDGIDETLETTVSTNVYALILNERIYSQVRYHYPANANGTSVVRYNFFDPKGEANDVIFTITYKTRIRGCEEIPNEINIFPNPATSNVFFDYSFCKNYSDATVEIVNILGKTVGIYNIEKQEDQIEIDISTFKPGIYFCTFRSENDVIQVEKLIIN